MSAANHSLSFPGSPSSLSVAKLKQIDITITLFGIVSDMRGSEGVNKGITRVSFFWCSSFDLIAISPDRKSGYVNIAAFEDTTNMGISIASKVEMAIANAVKSPNPRIEINPIAAGFCASLIAVKNAVAVIF